MTRRAHSQKLVGHLVLDTEFGTYLGDTRIRLLEGIDNHGSISKAAKAIPLSYKAAWDAVDAMNNLAVQPLVERTVGGSHGGGTVLTAYGRRMVAFYRALEEDTQGILDRVAARLGDESAEDVAQYRRLIRHMTLNTSARNQFAGPITALREGAVNFEVSLRLDEHNELTAMITRESAERLALAIGKEVHALVKASSVIIMTENAPRTRTSASNCLAGTVTRVQDGAVNAEVTLTLPGGRNVVAIVTRESVDQLGLRQGVTASAIFNASSVVLLTVD
jgi:molybdate transport system regulatory protein